MLMLNCFKAVSRSTVTYDFALQWWYVTHVSAHLDLRDRSMGAFVNTGMIWNRPRRY